MERRRKRIKRRRSEEIAAAAREALASPSPSPSPSPTLRSSPQQQEQARAKVIRWLLATRPAGGDDGDDGDQPLPQSGDLGVLVIVGTRRYRSTPDVGFVFHDRRVAEHFQLRIRVRVGADLDAGSLTRRILESVVCAPVGDVGEEDLDTIGEDLRRELIGKRFLLVLDDVWDGNRALDDVWDGDHAKWAALRAALTNREAGNKLLVTTQYAEVADMMQMTSAIIRALSLFGESSISGQKPILTGASFGEASSFHPEELTQHTKVMSRTPKALLPGSWFGEMPFSSQKGSPAVEELNMGTKTMNVMPTVMFIWSEFRESLSSSQRDTPAFEKLAHRSMFGKFLSSYERGEPAVEELKTYQTLFNVFAKCIKSRVFSEDCMFRSFSLFCRRIFDNLPSKLKYLRSLDLSFSLVEDIPDSIDELKHLCSLNLSYTNVRRLPESLFSLCNLRILILHQCSSLQRMHLKTFDISGCLNLSPLQKDLLQDHARDPGFSKIKDHEKPLFLSEGQRLQTPLASLGALGNRTELMPLQEDSSLEKHYESIATCLKEELRHLKVLWQLEIEYHVGQCFMPLTNGESIVTFKCKMLPHHTGVNNFRVHLNIFRSTLDVPERYDDDHLDNCSLAMCLGHHLTSLRSLSVSGSMNIALLLEEALPQMLSLHELEIYRCKGLMSLLSSQQKDLPSLKVLSIKDCLDLTSLPGEILCCMTALEVLRIIYCKQVSKLGFEELISLTSLWIEKCPKLIAASSEDSIAPLQSLSIDNTSLLATGFVNNLSSLQRLYIHNCTQLSYFTDEEVEGLQSLSSLRCLEIAYCYSFSSLPAGLHSLTSLKSLRITYCPKIQSLPSKGLPECLEELYICGCPMLKEWWKREKDACPIKFANISRIQIY